jgi:hypothetical protein
MTGAELIQVERARQIAEEGWDARHDDDHATGVLEVAARGYRYHGGFEEPPLSWPWDTRWWKPRDRKRNLIKAGALYQAEIDRLVRQRDEVAAELDLL